MQDPDDEQAFESDPLQLMMNERAYASSSELGDKYSYLESPYMMSGHQNHLML